MRGPIYGLGAVLAQWVFKSVYEALATPITYVVINFIKRKEGIDVYDRDVSFNPFKVS